MNLKTQINSDGSISSNDDQSNWQDDYVAEDVGFDRSLPIYTAHWKIFIPTFVVAIGYAVGWIYLSVLGMQNTHLARLFVIALFVFVPLLAAYGFLRYQTVRVQVLPGDVRFHPGWPRDMAADIPATLIKRVAIKKGLAGRVFGGGTLRIKLVTGQMVSVADLEEPYKVKAEIDAMLYEFSTEE